MAELDDSPDDARDVAAKVAKLKLVRGEIEAAEHALDLAISSLQRAPRSDKVTVSTSLEQALERLRTALAELAALEPRPSK